MGNNKYRILIVEDEANIRSFIRANLETSDYQVLCAETCSLGMMMYASHRPDLIILDLGLPDRDGLDLIREVRKSDVSLPIIVLSARSNERGTRWRHWIWGQTITSPNHLEQKSCWLVFAPFFAVSGITKKTRPAVKFQLQDLLIDYDKRQVFVGKAEIDLTQTEYNIMALLSIHAERC